MPEHHHHHHDHDHGHDHAHHHGHHHHSSIAAEEMPARHFRLLCWVFALTFVYLIVEIVGGLATGSLALLADGFHMFADATAIGISLFAAWFAHKPAPQQKTFGYQRLEIMAALFNGLILTAMSVFIIIESLARLQKPVPIEADMMMLIAFGGLLINVASAWLLHKDHQHNLNLKGAYLHVLGDLLGSVGAMVAGALILFFGWRWADPAIGVIIAFLVAISALSLLRDALNVLLEGCPAHIDIHELRHAILQFDGIQNVHHLHVWNIDLQRTVLTAHLEVRADAFTGETLSRVQDALKEQFGLCHVTLQMEIS